MLRRSFLASPLALASPLMAAPPLPTKAELAAYRTKCRQVLLENILPFWYPSTLDRSRGGFHLNHDALGQFQGPAPRMIVTQARMLWFFARLARFGHQPKEMLAAAEHGFRFLRDAMWDKRHGGFFWEVAPDGKPTKPNKHLYGQSFALYALAEYALASGRKEPLNLALKFFDLLEKQSHDGQYGGYVEYFLPDWSTAPPDEPIYMGGAGPGIKLMNTHLHLMEALTTLYRASRSPLVAERLRELMAIESLAVLRKSPVAATDKFNRDWTPRLEPAFARISYGHDIENIWLLADAAAALNTPIHPYRELFEANFAYCRQYGFDETHGGLYYLGNFNQPADDQTKSWWVQSETLVSALTMYRLTSETRYFEVFAKTWAFVDKHQIDWKNGEWHASLPANGELPTSKNLPGKAGPWKGPYHNGRAMIECIALLTELENKTA
ncbi:MAG: AGE family epimerase/isomerase [Bryobacter sp.]|nr:AGE family epimerase/isomerase [Bryobacter sp.]